MNRISRHAGWMIVAAALAWSPGAAIAQMQCGAVSGGQVAWYPGNGNTRDLAAANDGTLENGAGFGAGVLDQAFSLDGDDDFVSAPTSDATDPTTAGSIAAWIRLTTLPSAAFHIMEIVGRGSSGNDFDLQVDTDDRVRLYIAGGTHASSTTIFATDTWYHVAGAWDSTTGLRIYVNGALEEENPTLLTRQKTGQPLWIGDQPWFGPRRFAGLIDDVRVYDRALTPDEVAALACAAPSNCGDANDDGSVKAGDALTILRAGVGQDVECPAARCDTDSSGAISASDALRDLKFGVGQNVALLCPR